MYLKKTFAPRIWIICSRCSKLFDFLFYDFYLSDSRLICTAAFWNCFVICFLDCSPLYFDFLYFINKTIPMILHTYNRYDENRTNAEGSCDAHFICSHAIIHCHMRESNCSHTTIELSRDRPIRFHVPVLLHPCDLNGDDYSFHFILP